MKEWEEGGMDDDVRHLRELVDALDRAVPRENAVVEIADSPDGNTSRGTQRGYLRLGVELLKAGLDPIEASERAPRRLPFNGAYLMGPGAISPFELCELVDATAFEKGDHGLGAFGQLGSGVVTVGLIVLALIGGASVLSWLLR